MVPPSLLCHPPLDYVPDSVYLEQTGRSDSGILVDFDIVLPTVARHVAGAQRPLSPDLQVGVLASGDRRLCARLGWRQPTRGDCGDRGADRHVLLLHPYADPNPADRKAGAAVAAAEQHQRRSGGRRGAVKRRRGADGEALKCRGTLSPLWCWASSSWLQ